ncbi:MAG: type II secretion system protein [Planctomycetes bacterium]|nr:type II secretion system protein [Planctomycetota bacterium]
MMRTAISRRTGGYTVLELLMVVTIVIALTALVLIALRPKAPEIRRTETIIHTVRSALAAAQAQTGSDISPTEHPFAGSQAAAGGERLAFVRSDPRWSGMVATSGMALKGVPDPDWLTTDQDRLLMADDRFADRRIALLYGAKRGEIGVLQSLRKVVTRYRLLPAKAGATKVLDPLTGVPALSYTEANFPDTLVPAQKEVDDPAFGRLADTKSALDYLFGASNASAELSGLKALYRADPTLPEDNNAFRIPVEQRTIGGISEGLVYTDADAGAPPPKVEDRWKPGRIPVTGSGVRRLDAVTGPTWVRYRLAGLAVYDAWGSELLTATSSNGSHRIISAGLDGVLAVAPGANNRLDTDLTGELRDRLPIDAQDHDGAKDNLQ